MPNYRTQCVNCGAPAEPHKCSYCGTQYPFGLLDKKPPADTVVVREIKTSDYADARGIFGKVGA